MASEIDGGGGNELKKRAAIR
ncbi:hypothetical protein CCACVL1_20304 [Corchorus capsularis]|uniref:Uncharacterized protein n=1 Tax=Corchorus capsularis TaxID=210143 RepID=A0A1R3HBT7_COCAP|nr:hypothetical protein CCACVL1_20304 [Corchorus capsularis]